MEPSQELVLRIDRYLANEMGQKERESFEKEVASNEELAEELSLQEEVMANFGRLEREETLRSWIQEVNENRKPSEGSNLKTQVRPLYAQWYVWAAAAVILLLVISQLIFTKSAKDQAIYMANLEVRKSSPSFTSQALGDNDAPREVGMVIASSVKEAFSLAKKGNELGFREKLETLEESYKDFPNEICRYVQIERFYSYVRSEEWEQLKHLESIWTEGGMCFDRLSEKDTSIGKDFQVIQKYFQEN